MDAVRTNRLEAHPERIKKHEQSRVHMKNCVKLAVLGNISKAAQLDDGHRVAVSLICSVGNVI